MYLFQDRRESMRRLLESFPSINLGILIIGFLFLQDYYVATNVFNMSAGLFLENFVYKVQGLNFIAFMVFIPLLIIATIFYISYSIYTIGKQFNSEYFWLKLSIIIFSLFILVFYESILKLLDFYHDFYLEILLFVSIFSFSFRLYKSIESKLPISYIVVFIISVAILSWLINGFFATWLTFTVIGFFWSLNYSFSIFEDESFKNMLKSISYKTIIFFVFFLGIDLIYLNNHIWTKNKLEVTTTIGMLNKTFLVENKSDVIINHGYDFLDIEDRVPKMIKKSNEEQTVYYLPISSEMKWYFVNRTPNLKNAKITVYGIEEKSSTFDPSLKVSSITFSSHFDLNVSE